MWRWVVAWNRKNDERRTDVREETRESLPVTEKRELLPPVHAAHELKATATKMTAVGQGG